MIEVHNHGNEGSKVFSLKTCGYGMDDVTHCFSVPRWRIVNSYAILVVLTAVPAAFPDVVRSYQCILS